MKKVVLSGCVNWGSCSCTEASLSIVQNSNCILLCQGAELIPVPCSSAPIYQIYAIGIFDRIKPQGRQNKMIENNEEAQKSMEDRGAVGHRQCYFQLHQSLDTASMTASPKLHRTQLCLHATN